MSRQSQLLSFLSQTDWAGNTPELLAGDASNRRYFRVFDSAGKPAVIMDAPPEKGEDISPFITITNCLRALNFSAPEIYAADTANGFLLLEDLGDDLFARVLNDDLSQENQLYAAATDLLAELHKAPAPDLPPYDAQTCLREVELVIDWYMPAILGDVPPPIIADFQTIIADLCSDLVPETPVLVQRDYHAENLLWLPTRDGHQKVGLLDFQDALAGHAAYDLVSLLEDARRDTSITLQNQMLERYISASGTDAAAFKKAYATLGAQRNIKILGIFARLSKRDHKPNYVALMPRVWAHLHHDLEHPALSALKTWITTHLPAPTQENRALLAAQA